MEGADGPTDGGGRWATRDDELTGVTGYGRKRLTGDRRKLVEAAGGHGPVVGVRRKAADVAGGH